MAGERLETAEVTPTGLAHDRAWVVVDSVGAVLTARQKTLLFECRATVVDDRAMVTLPDGSGGPAGEPETDRAVSDFLEEPVRLAPAPGGVGPDVAAVDILTESSLRHLAALAPASAIDVRRFRPNLLVAADGDGPIEQAWIGRTLSVGSARLAVTEGCVRCVMTTIAQPAMAEVPALPRDLAVLKTISNNLGQVFSIYAEVLQAGRVSVGDTVTV